MSEAEFRSNILTFIAAGHETTANLPSWSLFLLSQSSEWRDRVAAEAEREIGGLRSRRLAERLVVTRAVIEEAPRLYPPIAAISRVATGRTSSPGEARQTRFDGRDRTLRSASASFTVGPTKHFDPGRFLGGARTEIDRFAYIPFGAGARTCIGSAFALQEATLVLATIMNNFCLQLAPGNPSVAPYCG